MERLGPKGKVVVAVVLVVAAGFCFYRFLLAPQLGAYAATKKELAELRVELARAQATAASLGSEAAKLEKTKAAMSEVKKFFDTEVRYGAGVVLLGLKAAANNVDITSIEPGSIYEAAYSLQLPLKITVEGDYRRMVAFCNDVESLTSLAELRSLKFEAAGSASASSSSGAGAAAPAVAPGRVKASLAVVLYSSKTPEGALQLEETAKWLMGPYNSFPPAGSAWPIPELAGHVRMPAAANDSAGSAPVAKGVPGDAGSSTPQTTTGAVYGSGRQGESDYVWPK